MTPHIAVCVSTRDRADRLARLLRAIAAQSLDPADVEVVVVDDGSADHTPAVLAEAAASGSAITALRHEQSRGPAAGRNAAWRAASAPIIAFVDDDCTPASGWLAAGLTRFAAGADVVVGAVARHPDQQHRSGRFARELVVGRDQVRWYATANVFYRRADLDRLGGFDEGYRSAAAEDTDLGFRAEDAGLRVVFEQSALVFHDVTAGTVWDAVRDQARWADLARLFAAHPRARADTLWRGVFWRQEHAEVLALGLATLTASRRPGAMLLALPWLHGKLCRDHRADETLASTVMMLPGLLAVDVAETVAAVRGSVRARTLFL